MVRYGLKSRIRPMSSPWNSCRGFSLLEVLIVLGIFSVLLGGIYSAFNSQMQHFAREFRVAEADIEHIIAKNVIERDIQLAGYGLAEDFTGITLTNPAPAGAVIVISGKDPLLPEGPDELLLYGTALGLQSRQTQEWTYSLAAGFGTVGDMREELQDGDQGIVVESNTKRILRGNGGNDDWLLEFDGVNNPLRSVKYAGTLYTPPMGALVYGMHGQGVTSPAVQPYYAVRYYLGGAPPGTCAPGTQSLLRAESRTVNSPVGGDSLLNCVLDMEVDLWVDTTNDDVPDLLDNGGVTAATYTAKEMRERIKQVRAYILVQASNRELGYTYPQPTVRVGDAVLGTGRVINLTDEQRRYRWRLLTLNVTPRNLR